MLISSWAKALLSQHTLWTPNWYKETCQVFFHRIILAFIFHILGALSLKARSFIHAFGESVAAAYDAYITQTGGVIFARSHRFPSTFSTGAFEGARTGHYTTAEIWWKTGLKCGLPGDLAEIALKLAALRPSTADLERGFSRVDFCLGGRKNAFDRTTKKSILAFSSFANTYGNKRCRLGTNKAFKLTFTFTQLKVPDCPEDEDNNGESLLDESACPPSDPSDI